MRAADEAVPVLLVAGAMGAGKTTLLARWMAEPAFAHAAVLVNELGEAPFDAHLLRGPASNSRPLAGGCACCSVRGALGRALQALDARRSAAAAIDRVAVELAGVALPRPLLEDFAGDAPFAERFPLWGIATVVDAAAGPDALRSEEARAQVAAADVLVLAKAEHRSAGELSAFVERVARINPYAEVIRADGSADEGTRVWRAAGDAPSRALRHLDAAVAAGAGDGASGRVDLSSAHGDALRVHVLRLEAPVELSAYCVRVAAFLEAHGGKVERVKGLVAVEGRRGPALVQAVRGALQPVRTLAQWPAGAGAGALVVVTRGMREDAVRAALS